MSFADGLRRFQLTVEERSHQVFVGSVAAAKESIVFGSPITGSPGQPVGQYGPDYNPGAVGGTLRASWTEEFLSASQARVSTNLVYAPPIEDGIGPHGPIRIRSTVGGIGSVAKTVAGWQRLVEYVTQQVVGGQR